MMHRTRRGFIKELALGLCATPLWTGRAQAPSARIRHASFGTGGMAWQDLQRIAAHPSVEVVAGCDVDVRSTANFRATYPKARVYSDYRELLAQEKDLQSVNVSTPDHMHAPIAMASMQRGLHVYGQKPLAHGIAECRALTEFARKHKLVTQMGIQIHSNSEYRTAVDWIQKGVIGKVKRVHMWSGKSWSDKGVPRASAIPEGFEWDLWLGVAAARPYAGGGWYHPGNWRKRPDFGAGTLGDMGCHIFDPVFAALALAAPVAVRSEGPAPTEFSWPADSIIHYVFAGTPFTEGPTLDVTWYDGNQLPPPDVQAIAGSRFPYEGSIFLGTEGAMILPHIAQPQLVKAAGKGIVAGSSHWQEFVDAILGKARTSTSFDYSGPLTEAVLLGCLASRFPKTQLLWDSTALAFTNQPAANAFVHHSYRKGWEVPGL